MSEDVQTPLKLSPALSLVIRRQANGDYSLHWADGFFRFYVNKEDAIREYRKRYKLVTDSGIRKRIEGVGGWREQLRELARDLATLSHTDFDILSQIKVGEAHHRQITIINKRPIELAKNIGGCQ